MFPIVWLSQRTKIFYALGSREAKNSIVKKVLSERITVRKRVKKEMRDRVLVVAINICGGVFLSMCTL